MGQLGASFLAHRSTDSSKVYLRPRVVDGAVIGLGVGTDLDGVARERLPFAVESAGAGAIRVKDLGVDALLSGRVEHRPFGGGQVRGERCALRCAGRSVLGHGCWLGGDLIQRLFGGDGGFEVAGLSCLADELLESVRLSFLNRFERPFDGSFVSFLEPIILGFVGSSLGESSGSEGGECN